jgi:mycofactocin precursor peptide peptidase
VTRLDTLTWPEVDQLTAGPCVLLLPTGSTEQHGPHLPLTTDTDIAVAFCEHAVGQRDDVVMAPALPYGSSGEHQGFAGTLSIGQEAVESVLVELVRSAGAFAGVLVVSAHGGNAEPFHRAVSRVTGEGHRVLLWSPPWTGDLHAGRTETSLMLTIAPERMHPERAEPGDTRPAHLLLPELRRQGVKGVSANGVLGDPTGASAEEGRRLFREGVAHLVATLDRWQSELAGRIGDGEESGR